MSMSTQRKREVRFAREQEVYDAIYEAVHNALLHRELIPVVPVGKQEQESKTAAVSRGAVPEPFEKSRRMEFGRGNVNGDGSAQTGNSFYQNAGKTGNYSSTSSFQAGNMLREQAVYQPKTFSKEEDALFAGTLKAAVEADEKAAAKSAGEAGNQASALSAAGNTESSDTEFEPKELEGVQPYGENSAQAIRQDMDVQGTQLQHEDTGNTVQNKEEPPRQLELFQEKLLAPESRSRHKLIGQLF